MRLSCPVVELKSDIFVDWKKDGELIHAGWERFRQDGVQKRTLVIHNIELGDIGVYVCDAVNGFGSVQARYFLYVMGE